MARGSCERPGKFGIILRDREVEGIDCGHCPISLYGRIPCPLVGGELEKNKVCNIGIKAIGPWLDVEEKGEGQESI